MASARKGKRGGLRAGGDGPARGRVGAGGLQGGGAGGRARRRAGADHEGPVPPGRGDGLQPRDGRSARARSPSPPPDPRAGPAAARWRPPIASPPGLLRHLPLSDPGRALGPRRRLPAGGDPPGAPAPPRPRPPFTPRSPCPPGARASAGPRGSGSGRCCSNLPAPSGDRWVGLAGKSLGVVVAGGDLPGLREVHGGSADCPGGRAQGRAGLERGRRPARGGGLMLTGFGALRSSSWPRGRTRTTS